MRVEIVEIVDPAGASGRQSWRAEISGLHDDQDGLGHQRPTAGQKSQTLADAKTLEGRRTTLDQTSFEQQAVGLRGRADNLQRKAQLRDREVSATEQKAVGRIGQEMEPLIRQVYQQKACSMLLQRTAVVIANPAMDITPQVIAALNAKITQFAFDRERLDGPAAATAPGGAPPIVQTPGATPRPAAPVKR